MIVCCVFMFAFVFAFFLLARSRPPAGLCLFQYIQFLLVLSFFAVPVRPRRMIPATYTFDTDASNTISNGELTAYRIIKLHRNSRSQLISNVCFFASFFLPHSDRMHICTVTCFQNGIEVQKSKISCEIKSGCKLIQKTGQCCPEYQCGMYASGVSEMR